MWAQVVEYAPQIIALLTAVLMLAELGLSLKSGLLRKDAEESSRKRKRNWFLVIGTTLSTFAFIIVIFSLWQPKDAWALWREGVAGDFKGCVAKNASKVTESYSKGSLDSDCLALTLQKRSLPGGRMREYTDHSQTKEANIDLDSYLRGQRAGMELMRIPEIVDNLKDTMGIYSNLFLGSGQTALSNGINKGPGTAIGLGVQEYLVRNYCIGGHSGCTSQNPGLLSGWGWMLKPSDMDVEGRELTIGDIIQTRPPDLNGDDQSLAEWDRYRKLAAGSMLARPDPSERFLVRFSQFERSKYSGTLAPPQRRYAFFSDARDVWRMTYKDAVIASGRIANSNERDSRVFIWFVSLDPSSSSASGPATWDYILKLLAQGSNQIEEKAITL